MLGLAAICSLPIVLLACTPNSPVPDPNSGQFIGSYEEVIELPGPVAAGFSDSDFDQLLRPDDIPPVYSPMFVPASEADLPDDELVIGLAIGDDTRTYPAGILFAREMVNDVVGGVPVLVSWCPRCYTALVHDRRAEGHVSVFGNHGALYKGAMTWFDHETGTVWSQPLGAALAGPRAGATLPLIPSQLTTWSDWSESHPRTSVLVVDEPSQPFRGRRPGPDHVVGVVVGDTAVALPYDQILPAMPHQITVGDINVTVWRDAQSDAIQATQLHESGNQRREIPVLIAYRSAWLKFYPDSLIDPTREPNR